MPVRLGSNEIFHLDLVEVRFDSERKAEEAEALVDFVRASGDGRRIVQASTLEDVRTRLSGLRFDEYPVRT